MKNILRFSAVIKIIGVNPYVTVSAKRTVALRPNWRKPMPVLVRVNGKPKDAWRINLMPKGDGSFYLYLHGHVRTASGTKVGDRVTVELTFDEEYRNGPQHPLPLLFETSLAKNARARKTWNALSPSRQKEVLRYFAGLKSAEALERNVTRMVTILSGTDDHFVGRDWKDGK